MAERTTSHAQNIRRTGGSGNSRGAELRRSVLLGGISNAGLAVPLLAHANALSPQLPPDPRPAVGSAIRRINGADMHQQRLITQMATLNNTPPANQVFMVTGHAHPQNSALHADRPHPPVTFNKGVLHFWPFAKYAVAFPRMSRSILTRANPARKRLISICPALTALRLEAPCSRPCRCALTQLNSVCSTTPTLRAAAAMLWPDSTSRTASCLNSSVNCARVDLVIFVSLVRSEEHTSELQSLRHLVC